MRIRFNIEYRTEWGEEIHIILSKIDAKGQVKPLRECQLETFDGRLWESEMNFQRTGAAGIEYKYALYRNGTLVWTEWEAAPHRIIFEPTVDNYTVTDFWRPIPDNLPLFSSAYTETVGGHKDESDTLATPYDATLQLRVIEPRLRKGEHLAICGSSPQLGEWKKPQLMKHINLQEWALNIDASLLFNEAEYKYVIVNDDNEIIRWEESLNRRLRSPQLSRREMWIKTDYSPNFSFAKWKSAGVVIPVFSLRSYKSYGIGDFGDLKSLIPWAVKTQMHAIQILPINDTTMDYTWRDSYPYNAISVFALHPIYCNISALPRISNKLQMEKFMMRQQELNQLTQVDYEQVMHLKMQYLKAVFQQEGQEVLATEGFQAFFDENKDWLVSYAAFCYLRDKYQTADFSQWEKNSKYSKREIDRLTQPESEAYATITLYYYIQYQLHLQLLDVRNTARANGVIIKGDIPIGINRQSVEAWTDPHLFNMNGQAGAPPDDFSVNGQNWGFPTYNWKAMAEDNYKWWTRRFQKMAEYFDAYRIDHVLGFFRIWEIPMHSVHGLLGQFSPSMPMSVNEIEKYGLKFRHELFTRPYITDEIVENIFGYKKDLIVLLYLEPRTDGRYNLKPEYSSQRKIEAAFASKTDEDSLAVRDGLYRLASNVLFVPDTQSAEQFHPRISAHLDLLFQDLAKHEKDAFMQLYNDYFYNRHNDFWYEEAMQKLPRLTQSTRMLVCAEDLGMVPACVPWVMKNLRMLSLEIQTMPKALGMEFGRLQDNPYLSVATIATHDMSPLRLWWQEDKSRAQRFYNEALQKDGPAPAEAPGWLCEDIVARHLFSPSILCLLSLQDWLSIDENLRHKDPSTERINIPSNPRHYWRYRMHLNIEQLMQADQFNDKISTLIQNSGRA